MPGVLHETPQTVARNTPATVWGMVPIVRRLFLEEETNNRS